MTLSIGWAPVDAAFVVDGSRKTATDTLQRLYPSLPRPLAYALVDFIRRYHATTGRLAPEPEDD